MTSKNRALLFLISKLKKTYQFPRIFTIASSKNTMVEEGYSVVSGSGGWIVNITKNLNDQKIEEYDTLLFLLSQIQLNDHRNQLVRKLRKQRDYSVKSFYRHLTRGKDVKLLIFLVKQIWKTKAPPRITFFAWEASRECIPTIDKLMRRGKILVNCCFLCKLDAESCNHVLLWCPMVYSIQSMLYGLLGINWVIAGPVRDELWAWACLCKEKTYFLLISLSIFWKERNTRAFGSLLILGIDGFIFLVPWF